MINGIINQNPIGADVIKGGIFFPESIVPGGYFSTVPSFVNVVPTKEQEASLVLTLQKVKDSLSTAITSQTGATTVSNNTVESYLSEVVDLLIDYRDIRNYVFYGSANTELAYNINYLINNYPYSTLIGQPLGSQFISLRNYLESSIQKTEIIFPEIYYYSPDNFVRILLDNYNRFNYYDDSNATNWSDYQIVDKNNKRYNIDVLTTPYGSPSIFNVTAIDNISTTLNSITYDTIRVTTDAPHGYVTNQIVSFVDIHAVDPTFEINYFVNIFNGTGYDSYFYPLNSAQFEIDQVTSDTFTIKRINANAYENISVAYGTTTYNYNKPGIVRLYPDAMNTRPFVIRIIIDGNLTQDQLINFDVSGIATNGFMISPTISIINDWNASLSPIQNMLLSPAPINPTPWPRRPVTNNIMNIYDTTGADITDQSFVLWINDPATLYTQRQTDSTDVDAAWTSFGLDYEYNMLRALALDETETNQLVRRCIPADIISEIYDTPNFYFQRFILIAGWLFDNMRLYAKFIKYAHTINYTDYDQLSPQYYKYLADNWGLELFNDDSTDFSKLVITTVPGEYFGLSQQQIEDNKYYQQTIQQLLYARQKNLLMSLIFLYKQKGTQSSLYKLISLLGAPDGLLELDEYVFQVNNTDNIGYPKNGYQGSKQIDNTKVHVPVVTFEIDSDYLLNKNDIADPINQPYVYKKLLDNEYTHNLREISLLINPNGAIDNQIENSFGEQKYNYVTFGKGEFSNLQAIGKYFLLPLSLPDRFFGMSLEYMIPTNGIKKGIGTNQEEAVVDVFSLYRISKTNQNVSISITNIVISQEFTTLTVTTTTAHGFFATNKVFISGTSGIINVNNQMFVVQTVIDPNNFIVVGSFSGNYTGGGAVISGTLTEFDNNTGDNLQYSYPLAIRYPQRNKISDTAFALDTYGNSVVDGYTNPDSDFNILFKRYPASIYIQDSYIITRLEGNDLVVRLRIQSEISGVYGERCALYPNIFNADGLNHTIKLLLRETGIEIYIDYAYVGLARWINISNAGPYKAYEIPKSEIKSLVYSSDDCQNYYEPISVNDFIDRTGAITTNNADINWWDLFIGMPDGVDFYFKKLNFFENEVVNDYNIGDNIVDTNGDTSEFYLFEVANPTLNSTVANQLADFVIPALFYEQFPNSIPIYYGYALPQVLDQYNRNIVKGLNLTNKRCYNEVTNNLILNKIQSFFDFSNLFENNVWQYDIHKSYEYNLFSGLLNNLYSIYSSQVLTYSSLEDFMELVEQKFKSTFESFIPMVVNVNEYGRLITNSRFVQPKMRLINGDKLCQMQYASSSSVVYTNLFQDSYDMPGIKDFEDFSFSLVTSTSIVISSPITVSFTTNRYNTLVALKNAINGLPIAVAGHLTADVYSDQIRISVNYDWFFSMYNINPNSLQLIIVQGSNTFTYNFNYGNPIGLGYHGAVIDACGETRTYAYNDQNVCGSISYVLPNLKAKPPYIYFETENKPSTYIRFSTEIGFNPVYVHYSTE